MNFNLFELQTQKAVFKKMGLTILSQQMVDFCQQQIVLAIIGESHLLWVKGSFMELLACTELADNLPKGMNLRQKVQGQALNNFSAQQLVAGGAVKYAVNISFVEYNPEPIPLTVKGEQLVSLEEFFPFTYGGLILPCYTKVVLTALNESTLLLKTSHDYPWPDAQTVLTNSTWQFFCRS